jgi:hypothetical protein
MRLAKCWLSISPKGTENDEQATGQASAQLPFAAGKAGKANLAMGS